MENIGSIGQPYRPPADGWKTGQEPIYLPFFKGSSTSSYLIQDAINDNVIMPRGVIPTTGSPYSRKFALACGSDESCYATPSWCCDDTSSMVGRGCPHGQWLQPNPIDGYNSTFPFIPIYPTASLVTHSLCENWWGYKNVQAKKYQQGNPPLTDCEFYPGNNVESSCSGNIIDYRGFNGTPNQTTYRSVTWDLNYSADVSYAEATGSSPCDDTNTPWSLVNQRPGVSWTSTSARTVVVDEYSGEVTTNTTNVDSTFTEYFSGSYEIDDNCGGVFGTINMDGMWTREHLTGCGDTAEEYDFPNGHYDSYGNPQSGPRSYHNPYSYDPGNPIAGDLTNLPAGNNHMPIFVELLNEWNVAAGVIECPDYGNLYPPGVMKVTTDPIGPPAIIPNVGNSWDVSLSFDVPYPADCVLLCDDPKSPLSGSAYTNKGVMGTSTLEASFTRTATSYTFNITTHIIYGSCGVRYEDHQYDGSITLGDAYTGDDVQAQLDTLLSTWELTDNNIYPPRIDGYAHIAPLVTYNENYRQPSDVEVACPILDLRSPIADSNGNAPYSTGGRGIPINDIYGAVPYSPCWIPTYEPGGADWTPTYDTCAWFDKSSKGFYWSGTGSQDICAATGTCSYFDGSILGKPSIVAGSGSTPMLIKTGNWDWRFPVYNYKACHPEDGGYPAWYVESYGQVNIGQFGLPLTATQWTNNYDAQFLFPYSFNINLGLFGWKQKFCEVKQTIPSWNFNKPYGQDRFTVDETAVSCYTDWSTTPGQGILYSYGGDATASAIFLNPTIPPSTNDLWGGTDVNGFFSITGVSGDGVGTPYSLTTGSLVLNLPAGFENTFCRLSYPNCPAFGTTPIIVTYDHTHSVIEFETPQNQYSGSAIVDFYKGTFNPQNIFVPKQSPLASSVTINYVDDFHASASGDFQKANFLISSGSKTWWCDDQPKGQVVTLEWVVDNRTNSEVGRLSGLTDCMGLPVPTGSNPNLGYKSFKATQVSIVSASLDGIPENECGSTCGNTAWIIYSNNDEGVWSNNSRQYSIPNVTYDYFYNSRWQGEVVQNQQTFDFQTPHKRCEVDPYYVVGPRSDDGSCQGSYTVMGAGGATFYHDYYGLPQQIEPFLTLPTTKLLDGTTDGAPNPLSSSGHFKWMIDDPTVTSSGITPPYIKNVAVGGAPVSMLYIWNLKANACATICSLYDYKYLCPDLYF